MLPFLDGEYSQKRTEFKKVLLGISAERERWNQCVDLVNKKMGMAVGALFIRDNFDPKSKETAQEMIRNIREAFNELLEENSWMDEETIKVAREKANAMNERIGYPDLLTNPVELSKEYEGKFLFIPTYRNSKFSSDNEFRNMVFKICSRHISWGPELSYVKGAYLPSGKLATWPVRHCQWVPMPKGRMAAKVNNAMKRL
ncbi:Neprilysin-1 [Araneus ventricosus]|uniref:Neprilysin-1 n=1 Tax=Araneus ventricosus TaxID=182803 RepID=A0A4Y2DVR1_ARAVE|nr:Neprilysin-1 [Araneus ventricosus]